MKALRLYLLKSKIHVMAKPSRTALLKHAINEAQYDCGGINWEDRGGPSSSRTQFYWQYIEPYAHTWKGKSILDVGAGFGWLAQKAQEFGASKVIGIDPSEKNIALAKKYYPHVQLLHTSFEAYKPKGQSFDVILFIMSLPHIADVKQAYRKLSSILNQNGEILVILPDYDHYVCAAEGHSIQQEKIDAEQFAVSITRSTGTIVDIVRKITVYQRAAERADLTLIEDKPMFSTVSGEPNDYPTRRLLRFKGTANAVAAGANDCYLVE